MKKIHRLIGGAGTGKTTRNMQSIADIVESGIDPMEILFSSFTRVARETAAKRAQDITGYQSQQLIRDGWFKTLQSVCYKCLGVHGGAMLTDNKSSRDWFSELFDVDFSKQKLETEDGGLIIEDGMKDNAIAAVIQEWTTARMMLITADDESRWPVKAMPRDKAMQVIARYEQQKIFDDKLDFADLALKFVGIKHDIHSLVEYEPECSVPHVAACIFDEYQDTSELLHRVALRIVESPTIENVVISGDPYQSIFNFCGSSNQWLMNGFNYTSSEIMPQSYRCSKNILELGESAIRSCSDYFDRGIRPKPGDDGDVCKYVAKPNKPEWFPGASEDWLVVARTNFALSRATKWLSENNIPWVAADEGGPGYVGPRKRRVGETLWRIRQGLPIAGNEWGYAIEDIPAIFNGQQLLKRGVKIAAKSVDWHCPQVLNPSDLITNGATDAFMDVVQNSDWAAFDPAFRKFRNVADEYGVELAVKPTIRASTIHGAKGDEASNVLLCTSKSNIVKNGMTDEECRVLYVGATRAKDALVLFKFAGDKPGYFDH